MLIKLNFYFILFFLNKKIKNTIKQERKNAYLLLPKNLCHDKAVAFMILVMLNPNKVVKLCGFLEPIRAKCPAGSRVYYRISPLFELSRLVHAYKRISSSLQHCYLFFPGPRNICAGLACKFINSLTARLPMARVWAYCSTALVLYNESRI